jgi:hypothetical protein
VNLEQTAGYILAKATTFCIKFISHITNTELEERGLKSMQDVGTRFLKSRTGITRADKGVREGKRGLVSGL